MTTPAHPGQQPGQQPGRRPKGTPVGGQFTGRDRSEAAVTLTDHTHGSADTEGDEALAYLRSWLDDMPLQPPAPHRPQPGLALHEVAGVDLPPLVFAHAEPLDRARIEPISTIARTKPSGGLWLSPGDPAGTNQWSEFCRREGFRPTRGAPTRVQAVALKPDARVLKIDSRGDLLAAAGCYPPPAQPYGFDPPGMDFAAVAADYDALWVTETGRSANHMPRDEHAEINLYAWDIETVLVLDPDALAETPPASSRHARPDQQRPERSAGSPHTTHA